MNKERTRLREVGTRLPGGYEIFAIKQGGMGLVYLVYQPDIGLPFAVKTFREEFLMNHGAVERFRQEARTWMQLGQHQQIVQALFVEAIDNRPHLFLEYVEGSSLREKLQRGPMQLRPALDLALQLCQGMSHAHAVGNVVHRDLKPSNIMLTSEGCAKVTDFGLVKALSTPGRESSDISPLGTADGPEPFATQGSVGTPEYMAPEQWSAEGPTDCGTDVYAFGVVLYEMLTGGRPFERREDEPPYVLHAKHLTESIPDPKTRNPAISDEVSAVILRCLRKKPEDRYPGFDDAATDIASAYEKAFAEPWIPRTFPLPPQAKSSRATQLAIRGVSLQCIDDHEAAISVLDEALVLEPSHSLALRLKGRSCCAMSKHAEALRLFREVEAGSRDDPQTQDDMAFCLNEMGRSAEALHHAERSIQLDPRGASSRNNRGIALANLGRFHEAEESFDEAIGLNAESAETWNNKGFLLVKTGRPDQAEACFRQAIDLNPRYLKPYFNLNDLVLQRGLKANEPVAMAASMREGCALMEAVLAVEPTHPAALKICSGLRQGLTDAGHGDR